MFGRLFLLFTVVPALELILLIEVGGAIGTQRTIAIIIITGILGAYLSKREGVRVWTKVQEKLAQGIMPGNELVDALLIFGAGALLLTPGFLTDLTGFALLVPPVRAAIRDSLKKRFASSITVVPPTGPGGPTPPWEA